MSASSSSTSSSSNNTQQTRKTRSSSAAAAKATLTPGEQLARASKPAAGATGTFSVSDFERDPKTGMSNEATFSRHETAAMFAKRTGGQHGNPIQVGGSAVINKIALECFGIKRKALASYTVVHEEDTLIPNVASGKSQKQFYRKEVEIQVPVVPSRCFVVPVCGPLISMDVIGIGWDGEQVSLPPMAFQMSGKHYAGIRLDDKDPIVFSMFSTKNGSLNSGAAAYVKPLYRLFAGYDVVLDGTMLPIMVLAPGSKQDGGGGPENSPWLNREISHLVCSIRTWILRNVADGSIVLDEDANPLLHKCPVRWEFIEKHESPFDQKDFVLKSFQDKYTVSEETWAIKLRMPYDVCLPADLYAHSLSLSIDGDMNYGYIDFDLPITFDHLDRSIAKCTYTSKQGKCVLSCEYQECWRRFCPADEGGDFSLCTNHANCPPFMLELKAPTLQRIPLLRKLASSLEEEEASSGGTESTGGMAEDRRSTRTVSPIPPVLILGIEQYWTRIPPKYMQEMAPIEYVSSLKT